MKSYFPNLLKIFLIVHVNNLKRCFTQELVLTDLIQQSQKTTKTELFSTTKINRKHTKLKQPLVDKVQVIDKVSINNNTKILETPVDTEVDELEYDDNFDLMTRTQLDDTDVILDHCNQLIASKEDDTERVENPIENNTESDNSDNDEFKANYCVKRQTEAERFEKRIY